MNDILTTAQAAELLGVSEVTVRDKYIKRGLLPATKAHTGEGYGHTKWQIRRVDVEMLKARRESGDRAFKPGPEPHSDDYRAYLYFPRPPAWARRMTDLFSAEERARILEEAAQRKEQNGK